MSDTAEEGGPACVFVIDDKEVNLRLMRAYLQPRYRVETCQDPREALERIRALPPDLILLDLMMPVLDGFTVLEMLKTIAPEVPVIAVTGLADRDARLRALAGGARDFLTKPVDRSELLIRVHGIVALKQAGDELARAHAQLAAANRDLEAFAGGLAHDLQQPITTIGAFAQVIDHKCGAQLPPAEAQHLKRIIAAAHSARDMIRGLLEFARLGQKPIDMEPVDLGAVVAEARAALASAVDGRHIDWAIGALPVVRGDAALLRLAFVNLLGNAVKYSRTRDPASVAVECEREGAAVAVRIRDNGVGFDMARAGRLFSPFERMHSTTEFEGTGMGLANVRRIMERHGGSVHADSQPGHGATFTLVFRG